MRKIKTFLILQICFLLSCNELLARDYLSIADGSPLYRAKVNGRQMLVTNHKEIIGVNSAHRKGAKGQNVRVAVIDYPYDFGSDTRSKLTSGCLKTAPKMGSSEFNRRKKQAAGFGKHHANHVASTIAGRNGIAPRARLHVFDIFNDPSTRKRADRVAAAIYQAIKYKPHFINISLKVATNFSYYPDSLKKAYFAARNAGIGIIQAAANDKQTLGSTRYTRSMSQLAHQMKGFMRFVVATSYTSAGAEQIATFSNRAGIASKYVVAFPGQQILAYGASNRPIAMSGTSMAAPGYTGASASLLSANPSMKPNQIFNTLDLTARKYNLKTHARFNPRIFGQGVPDLLKALNVCQKRRVTLTKANQEARGYLRRLGIKNPSSAELSRMRAAKGPQSKRNTAQRIKRERRLAGS